MPKALQLEVDGAVAFAVAKGIRVPTITFKSSDKRAVALYSPSSDAIYINPRAGTLSANSASPGYFSTAHRFHTFLHELGHMAHHDKLRDRYDHVKNTDPHVVAQDVSRYAASNGLEFVAEVFVGLITGHTFSVPVMNLYRSLGGPDA